VKKQPLTSRQKQALADEAIQVNKAVIHQAQAIAHARFAPQSAGILAELKALPAFPSGEDAAKLMALRKRFDILAINKADYLDSVIADLLGLAGAGRRLRML